MRIIKILFVTFSFLLVSCSNRINTNKEGALNITTFNMEWLGDGINDKNPRKESDYKRFAEIIKNTGADIIACQEVENIQAINRIIKYLPDYKAISSNGGGVQNLAFIYNSKVDFKLIGDYDPLVVEKGKNRPGYLAYCKCGNFDFNIMAVHLKSTSRYDNTEEKKNQSVDMRTEQAAILSKWADSMLTNSTEKDLIIIGDFNDAPQRPKFKTLQILCDNPNLDFITKDLKSCGKFSSQYTIDNLLISKSALKRFIPESLFMLDITSAYTKEQLKSISDHCPVSAQFDCTAPDND
jgi:endonuclease/exonuclease/phosphatase family metal-dependent hydrolase